MVKNNVLLLRFGTKQVLSPILFRIVLEFLAKGKRNKSKRKKKEKKSKPRNKEVKLSLFAKAIIVGIENSFFFF